MYLFYIILGLAVIYILIKYWVFFLSLLVGIIALSLTITFISNRLLMRKVNKIQESDAISIPSQTLYSIPLEADKITKNLPLKNSKHTRTNQQSTWLIKSIRPELENGVVKFIEFSHEINKVKVMSKEPQDSNFQTIKQISPLTKEIFNKIDPQLIEFNKQKDELQRLQELVSSSEVYRSKAEIYARGAAQIQQLIGNARDLRQEYLKFIREILIGAELSRFDPESMSDVLERKVVLDSKYQVITSKYQDLKLEMEAYSELSKGSKV
jgi:hypothetical protein